MSTDPLGMSVMRRNGFQRPWHPLQLISWVVFTFLGLIFHFILLPAFATSTLRLALSLAYWFAAAPMVYYGVRVTRSEPLDVLVKEARMRRVKERRAATTGVTTESSERCVYERPEGGETYEEREARRLDPLQGRSKQDMSVHTEGVTAGGPSPTASQRAGTASQQHKQERNWCPYCHEHVDSSSKHCRICDKCVSNFDHHCKWLNTCVGGSNYALFFRAMSFALLLLTYECALSLWILIESFVRSDQNDTSPQARISLAYGANSNTAFDANILRVLCSLTLLLTFLLSLSLFQLFSLHVYLYSRGMTTYEWIMERRMKLKSREEENAKLGTQMMSQNKIERSVTKSNNTAGRGSVVEMGLLSTSVNRKTMNLQPVAVLVSSKPPPLPAEPVSPHSHSQSKRPNRTRRGEEEEENDGLSPDVAREAHAQDENLSPREDERHEDVFADQLHRQHPPPEDGTFVQFDSQSHTNSMVPRTSTVTAGAIQASFVKRTMSPSWRDPQQQGVEHYPIASPTSMRDSVSITEQHDRDQSNSNAFSRHSMPTSTRPLSTSQRSSLLTPADQLPPASRQILPPLNSRSTGNASLSSMSSPPLDQQISIDRLSSFAPPHITTHTHSALLKSEQLPGAIDHSPSTGLDWRNSQRISTTVKDDQPLTPNFMKPSHTRSSSNGQQQQQLSLEDEANAFLADPHALQPNFARGR